jgi:hypothetical protein
MIDLTNPTDTLVMLIFCILMAYLFVVIIMVVTEE